MTILCVSSSICKILEIPDSDKRLPVDLKMPFRKKILTLLLFGYLLNNKIMILKHQNLYFEITNILQNKTWQNR